MFIECLDVGLKWNANGDVIGVDETAPEHNQPVFFNADKIIFVQDVKLLDGSILGYITYECGKSTGNYYVQTRARGILAGLTNWPKIKEGPTKSDVNIPTTIGTNDYLKFFNELAKKPK